MSRPRTSGPAMYTTVLCVLLAAALPSRSLDAEDRVSSGADDLWRKAVAVVGASDQWSPGTTRLTGQETDGKGRIRSTWDVTIRSTLGADGNLVQVVTRYLENGRDVTEEKRRAPAPRAARPGNSGDGAARGPFSWNPTDPRQTPFHPSEQDRVTVGPPGAGLVRDGKACVPYAFEQRLGDRYRAVGTAWLDAASGAPVAMEATFEPLPPLVTSAHVELQFAIDAAGAWVVSHFRAGGEATILLIHRGYVMEMELHDHWKLPPATAAR